MKKILAILTAVVMIAAVCAAVSFAASEPALIITAEQIADEGNLTQSNNVEIELKEEGGVKFARITATGGDPHFYFGSNITTDAANKYAAIKYRTTTSGLTIDAYMAGAEPHTIFGEVNGDGNWNFLVGDLSQSGANWTGKFARFDPLNGNVANGDVLDVEWIALFASEDDAKAYTGGAGAGEEPPTPIAAGEDQYLCNPATEPGNVGQTTGWWMNPINGPDDKYITVNFKANGSFKGINGYYLTNPKNNEQVGATVVKVELLDASGSVLEEKEIPVDGDAWYETEFSKTYAAGTYAVRFVAVSGGGGWFVLGSAAGTDENVTVEHNCATNENTLSHPAVMLIGGEAGGTSEPTTPPATADAAVIAIAAVACIALAGVVVAKKVK